MDSILIFLIFVLFLIVVILLFIIFTKLNGSVRLDASMDIMQRWMEQMSQRLDHNADLVERNIRLSQESVADRLDKTSAALNFVGQRIGEMSEIGRSMRDLGDLLKTPKLRGNLGELVLKDLLRQFLPSKSFEMQYAFKNGFIVDAAIKTDGGVLCIDSKFPLENFKKMFDNQYSEKERESLGKEFVRDVKKHIDAISSKYINPDESSFDYALMYVPSEAVYYEIVCNRVELTEYAQNRNVIIVSPSVFYAYLQVILISLEGRKVEDTARMIVKNLKSVQIELGRFASLFNLGIKHLQNAKSAFDSANSQYTIVENKLTMINKEENELLTQKDNLPFHNEDFPEHTNHPD